jgi:hypothetical protein
MSLDVAQTGELGLACPRIEHTLSKKQAVCAQTDGDNSFQAANIKGTLSKYRRPAGGRVTAIQPQLTRIETDSRDQAWDCG